MNRSITLSVAALALLVSACGGGAPGQAPAEPPTPAPQSQPAPEAAAPPASTPAAPASAPQTAEAPVTSQPAPEKPIYTRTDIKVGTGAEAVSGRGLSVNYTGWL